MSRFDTLSKTLQRLSPFSVSLVLHALLLLAFTWITWYVPAPLQEDQSAAIVLHGTADTRLRFQDRDMFDRFKVEDHMVYPLPEIEYSPVLPDVQFSPEPEMKQQLDLISVQALDREWLQHSSGRQPLYTGEEKLAGSFTRHIQMLREGGLDIVFVFDATSSMAEFLRQVKTKIAGMIATYKKLVPTARIGIVAYRDVGEEFVTMQHPLTHGTRSLEAFLLRIEPVGGGDREEAVDAGLTAAIEEFQWRRSAKKIILLIGDAPPHARDMERTIRLIEKFHNRMHGVVSTLDTTRRNFVPAAGAADSGQVAMEEFQRMAAAGGGECALLIDEETVIREMVVLVFGSRWEMFLDEFLKQL